MIRKHILLILIAGLAPTVGHAQPEPLAPLSLDVIRTEGDCNDHYTAAVDDARLNTVSARAESARRYRACIEATLVSRRMEEARDGDLLRVQAYDDAGRVAREEANRLVASTAKDVEFLGHKWGAGFGFSFGSDDFIEEAEVVDDVVRVTKDKTDKARVLLEYHKFFWCNDEGRSAESGCGPFVALAATNDDVLSGVGMGLMYGWRSRKDPPTAEGFSIGIGVILDNDVKALADGFEAGRPLPPGEIGVRLEEKARWSTLIFVSRTF